ncbi:unnamed protein product [Prorocentrum cordatum]|uniref:Uncharacterized protein n=1 Tax=Prorocentrum cordatum TaxID=2364126 RepID=A0ABN9PSD6_9DINO|nr:unnamed protein product [Polarella glacialis]
MPTAGSGERCASEGHWTIKTEDGVTVTRRGIWRVCYASANCVNSPAVVRGPVITDGLKRASFSPSQLKERGSYRLCYCSAAQADPTGLLAAPCDADLSPPYAPAGVLYSLSIDEAPAGEALATCGVDNNGTLLSDCAFQVTSARGDLQNVDTVAFYPGVVDSDVGISKLLQDHWTIVFRNQPVN